MKIVTRPVLLLLVLALMLPAAVISSGSQVDDEPVRVIDLKLQERARLSAERGLEFLKQTQQADGSWTDKIGRKVHYEYRGRLGKHVGVSSLACLAFLAQGSLPGRGKYGEQVEKGLDFILRSVQTNGFISTDESRMYSHAFATLFLAEVYGMTGMEKVKEKLKSAVGLIVQAQNETGGWRYQPGADDADMSITVCQVMALRASRNAGIHVPKEVVDAAISYVRDSSNMESGGFMYQHEVGPTGRVQRSRTTFPLTAAGVTALYGAGVYEDKIIDRGLIYLTRHRPRRYEALNTFDYYYGMYYATQAAFQRGGEYWTLWHKNTWSDILSLQNPDGSWHDLVGPNYATAMACIILEIPFQYLPIFER
ncbi:MAG: terpene cyclase/mutase family protein [Planctomycetota bacterium]|nr:terpene cyclase/mutase family protein [Planctomycetota bacterium]